MTLVIDLPINGSSAPAHTLSGMGAFHGVPQALASAGPRTVDRAHRTVLAALQFTPCPYQKFPCEFLSLGNLTRYRLISMFNSVLVLAEKENKSLFVLKLC